jgi:hypothetical protein
MRLFLKHSHFTNYWVLSVKRLACADERICEASPSVYSAMGWQSGKSYYEGMIERALIEVSLPSQRVARMRSFTKRAALLCSDYRYNRSTWFSGRLRYDFVLGMSIPPLCVSPYLIEIHGEQHYRWDHDNGNDAVKKRLAIDWGCPFLVIPYRDAYTVSDELVELILGFLSGK